MSLRLLKSKSGFSLVELVCVVAIISMLAAMAMPAYEHMLVRARGAEATVNLSALMALVNSRYGNGDMFAGGAGPPLYSLNAASRNDYTSATSCNYTAALTNIGFRLNNCTKVRFVYAYTTVEPANTWGAVAVEGGTKGNKRVHPSCLGTNMWAYPYNGKVKQVINTLDPAACNTCYIPYTSAKIGGSDMTFDINGDNIVDVGDTMTVMGAMQTAVTYGTALNHMASCP